MYAWLNYIHMMAGFLHTKAEAVSSLLTQCGLYLSCCSHIDFNYLQQWSCSLTASHPASSHWCSSSCWGWTLAFSLPSPVSVVSLTTLGTFVQLLQIGGVPCRGFKCSHLLFHVLLSPGLWSFPSLLWHCMFRSSWGSPPPPCSTESVPGPPVPPGQCPPQGTRQLADVQLGGLGTPVFGHFRSHALKFGVEGGRLCPMNFPSQCILWLSACIMSPWANSTFVLCFVFIHCPCTSLFTLTD